MSIFLILISYFLINILVKLKLETVADLLTVLPFALTINFLLNYELKVPKVLNRLSDQSYSLYLFHLPVLMLYFSFLSYFTKSCVFFSRLPHYSGVAVAILLNIPLYYLVEYQSLKLISKPKK